MASQNDVFGEMDDHEEYLAVIAKEAKEALLDRKVKEMQKKNRDILKRHAVVEADRKAAEDSGCAVTLKSSQPVVSDSEKPNEVLKAAEEENPKPKGRGQTWGRGRGRAYRSRPQVHFGQNLPRDNPARESESFQDADVKRVSPSSPGNDLSSDKHSLSSARWDTGPSETSSFHPHESQSRHYNSSQKPKDANQGYRYPQSRGQSRGPFAKFVTVPDASHSHDVRHVEEVNDSIVINIDRSMRPGADSAKRGGRGGIRGNNDRSDFPSGMLDDNGASKIEDAGFSRPENAPPHRRSYRGRGRRPFRGHGDGSFRGHGRGESFRRGYGDGPRPFRGGYRGDRGDRARAGRTSRRAVIVTPKNEGEVSQAPEEDWDKEMVEVAAGAVDTSNAMIDGGNSLPNADDGDGKIEDNCKNLDESENDHAYEESNEYHYDESEEIVNQNQEEEGAEDMGGNGQEVTDNQPIASITTDYESKSNEAQKSSSDSNIDKTSELVKTVVGQSSKPEAVKEVMQPIHGLNTACSLEGSKTESSSTPQKAVKTDNASVKNVVKEPESVISASYVESTQNLENKTDKKEKSTDCDSALRPLLCVHG